MRVVAALLAAIAVAGCAERPRSNPFDPGNPSTGGKPPGFEAIAASGRVTLHWELTGGRPGVAYQLYRRIQGEPAHSPIGPLLPADRTVYVDTARTDGVTLDYRLYYVLSGSRSGLPAEDWAIPGPQRVWFADLGTSTLRRLSADGHRIAMTSTGFWGPTQVAFDSLNDRVWVSDTYNGQVVSVEADGTSQIRISGLTEPVAIAIDAARDRMWVCDQARDAVFQYRLDGINRAPASLAVDTPIGVAFDPNDGSVWVCERGAHRVRRFSGSGTPFGGVDVVAPSRVAVDSLTGDAWVTSFEGSAVFRISPAGVVSDTVALAGPIGVAVDSRNGRIWVADGIAGAVVALRRNGLEEFRATGFPRVREVAVDLASGECYATVPGSRVVVRLGPTGSVISTTSGLGEPYGITVEPR